jgi:hypothetical protein
MSCTGIEPRISRMVAVYANQYTIRKIEFYRGNWM